MSAAMRNRGDVIFRAARAEDVTPAVPLIYASGPDAFDYVFATREHDAMAFLRHAFTCGSGEFGFGIHIVGEINGHIVATGAGWTAASTLPFTLAAAGQFMGFFGPMGTPAVIVRGLRTEAVIRPPSPGEFYIGHLGVDPAWRGQGIGEALVGQLADTGRGRGLKTLALDVAVTNPRAQALYTRLGFTVAGERASTLKRDLGHVPPSRRMTRPL